MQVKLVVSTKQRSLGPPNLIVILYIISIGIQLDMKHCKQPCNEAASAGPKEIEK